jgi:hypothetical protein
MKIFSKEIYRDEDTVISKVWINGDHECYILEDIDDLIPAGEYYVKPRKVLSPMTERYRKRFPWFEWHLELQDVPGRKYIYIHLGNFEYDTDGCLLTGQWNESSPRSYITDSTTTFKKFYNKVYQEAKAGCLCIEVVRAAFVV